MSDINKQLKGDVSVKKHPISRNIYCLFRSEQSFSAFQKFRLQSEVLEKLMKTGETQNLGEKKERDIDDCFQDEEDNEIGPMMRVDNIENCKKCRKLLENSEREKEECRECQSLDKLIKSGHFQNFVNYIIEFKTGKIQSYNNTQRQLKRIQSIQSCQSFTLDKGHDSHIRNSTHGITGLKATNQGKYLNSLENTTPLISIHQNMSELTQGGYFCNQCMESIVGRRFHCTYCQDYDLCQKCYFYIGHKHEMKTMPDKRQEQAKNLSRSVMRRSQSLKNTLPLLSASLRNFQNIPRLFMTTALK